MSLQRLLDDATAPPVRVRGIADDSRRVRAGDVFVARRGGAFDGHDFAAAAVAAGATAVVSERPLDIAVPNVVVRDAGKRLGGFARRFYGAPSADLAVVGVTGTNGKTTVAHHIAGLCDAAGYIGTLGWGVPPRLCRSKLTTADEISLQAWLRALRDGGTRVVALEASSHALHQGRVDAVDFAGAVFTNLTRDHLDYHGSMREYAGAKRRLFDRPLRFQVVNTDDALGQEIAREAGPDVETVTVGQEGDVRWRDLRMDAVGIRGHWQTPWGEAPFTLAGYFGAFSASNAALALAVACVLGAKFHDVVARLGQLPPVPGRMQRVHAAPTVLVDFAHTPDALRTVLAAARAHLRPQARLIVLFGCGGDRDRGKRPLMARAAEQGADVVIATSDNPRGEDPDRILEDVMRGFASPDQVLHVADRREAIAVALESAHPHDIVLLAGKGHETYQEVGGRRVLFDDAALARGHLSARVGRLG